MSLFSKLSDTLQKGKETLMSEVSKFRNASFMEAIVASSVFIATADGNVSAEEKRMLMTYVKQAEELKAFSQDDIINVFNKLYNSYEFDAMIGKAEALKLVNRIKGNNEQARLVVRVAMAIANSDGVFDDNEKKALDEICSELGLNSADFM